MQRVAIVTSASSINHFERDDNVDGIVCMKTSQALASGLDVAMPSTSPVKRERAVRSEDEDDQPVFKRSRLGQAASAEDDAFERDEAMDDQGTLVKPRISNGQSVKGSFRQDTDYVSEDDQNADVSRGVLASRQPYERDIDGLVGLAVASMRTNSLTPISWQSQLCQRFNHPY
jgi:hypothetical protein